MIPKIIHYCWFGGRDLPADYQAFVSEWEQLHPDFKFILWNESNSPMEVNYLQNALANGNFANMSNYMRLFSLLKYGGIYLDIDFKLFKSLHPLLKNECFFGIESEPDSDDPKVNNAIMGATKSHSFIKNCLETLLDSFDGSEEANLSSPALVTSLLLRKGLTGHDYQILDGIHIYPRNAFYPIPWNKAYDLDKLEELNFKDSYGVHVWGRSWYSTNTLLKKIDALTRKVAEQNEIIKCKSETLPILANIEILGSLSSLPNNYLSNCLWSDLCKDVTYIITAPEGKREQVLFTLRNLNRLIPSLKFIYAEQSVRESCESIPLEDWQRLNTTYIRLLLNNVEEYDKLWGWNCALLNCPADFVLFADYELVPELQFLIDTIYNLKNKLENYFVNEWNCDINSVTRLDFIKQTYIEKEDRELFSPLCFIASLKDEWLNGGGFFEREIPPRLKSVILQRFLIKKGFEEITFRGSFYYDKETDYSYLFINEGFEPRLRWLINERLDSFFNFNSHYNELFGWGKSDRFILNNVEGKLREISEILTSPTVYKETASSFKRLALAITTFKRLDYLHDCLKTFLKTRNNYYEWSIIVADDGSSDGTISYLKNLQKILPELIVIENNRSGIAHQTNTIINTLSRLEFDCCFKCDDDVLFLKPNWEDIYTLAMEKTGQQHICHYSSVWRSADLKEENEYLVAHSDIWGVQGALFTITPEIINEVGYFDEISFGARGWAHIDYSIRCWRAGFAGNETIMDVKNSNDFIILNYDPVVYKTTMSIGTLYNIIDTDYTVKKKKIIDDERRIWLPYIQSDAHYGNEYLLELHQEALAAQDKLLNNLNTSLLQAKEELELHKNALVDNERLGIKIRQLQRDLAEANENILTAKAQLSSELNYRVAQEVKEKEIVQNWYKKEYEVLPLWYKRLGHIIKILIGKRTISNN